MTYDDDDPEPKVTLVDIYWHYANRWAEWGMGFARSIGWKEKTMFIHCQAPGCMFLATGKSKFLDPRRGHDDELAYITKYWCCETCQLAIADELERQANYARLVN